MSLIQLQRLDSKGYAQKRRPLWLVWVGEQFLELKDIWTQYARRTCGELCAFVELTTGIVLQNKDYTLSLPNFSTPKQCERWSVLMPLMTWQLWLAKDLVEEHHLPWQSPRAKLTPGRVAQSVLALLIEIGSPATSPKTRGKSPGWKQGKKRNKKKTYPIAKKSHSPSKKTKKEAV